MNPSVLLTFSSGGSGVLNTNPGRWNGAGLGGLWSGLGAVACENIFNPHLGRFLPRCVDFS